MRRKVVVGLMLAALAVIGASRRAPGFALPDSKMQVFDLADYRGKVVLLELMQTTCPHCNVFADILRQAEQKYGSKIQVLAVVKAPEDNSNTVAEYVKAHRATYPVLFDTGQMMFSYLRTGAITFPHVYVIDANGEIRSDYGYSLTTRDVFEGKALFAELDRMMAEKK